MPSGKHLPALVGVISAAVIAGAVALSFFHDDSPSTPDAAPAPTDRSTTAAPVPAGDRTGCQVGDAYAAAGEYEKALDSYLTVEVKTPDAACVTTGVANVTEQLGAEKTAESAGVDSCTVIDILNDGEAYDEAKKTYVEYVKKTGKDCDDIDLADTQEPTSVTDWIKTIIVWAAGVLLVAALLGCLLLFILRKKSAKAHRSLRRLAPPELKIGTFGGDETDGATGFRGRLQTEILRPPQDDPTQGSFHIVDAFQDVVTEVGELDKLNASLAAAGVVTRFFSKALGRDQWELDGVLEQRKSKLSGATELACTATFKTSGHASSSYTYAVALAAPATATDEPVATVEELRALTACVAGWARRVVAVQYGTVSADDSPTAEAYGWLRGGVEAHELALADVAEHCYKNAVDIAPDYARGRIALAMLQNENAPETIAGLEAARDLLERVSAATEPAIDDAAVDWLRLQYSLAATHAHLAITYPGDLSAHAREEFEKAVAVADTAIGEAEQMYPEGADPQGANLLVSQFVHTSLIPACRILAWGSTLCWYGEISAVEKEEAEATRARAVDLTGQDIAYRARYNLACYWSTWLERLPDENEAVNGKTPAEWGLAQLSIALDDAPASMQRRLAAWAKTGDPSLAKLRTTHTLAFKRVLDPYSR